MSSPDVEHTVEFLMALYHHVPGWLQIVDSNRNYTGELFTTETLGLRKAAEYAASRDGARGVYFRVTTMSCAPEKGRGGADLTRSVPALWADLDYGDEGHKRPPINPVTGKEQLPNPPTEQDAYSLIAAAGLPEPTILIHSGGGWYPLFVLARPVDTAKAALLSAGVQEAFKQASEARGWSYGTGVSDLARLLRIPGSVNRKTSNPRPCRVVGGNGVKITAAELPEKQPKAPKLAAGLNTAPRTPGPNCSEGGAGVFDVLAANTSWADILVPAGWTLVAIESTRWERWLRPGGADSEYSARAFAHNLVCHSESAGLPSGAGQRLTKGRVYAWLWYGGDLSAAARGLLQGENVGGLPSHVMDAIRRAADRPRDLPTVQPLAIPAVRLPRPVGFRPGIGDLDPIVAAALDVGLARRAEARR